MKRIYNLLFYFEQSKGVLGKARNSRLMCNKLNAFLIFKYFWHFSFSQRLDRPLTKLHFFITCWHVFITESANFLLDQRDHYCAESDKRHSLMILLLRISGSIPTSGCFEQTQTQYLVQFQEPRHQVQIYLSGKLK